MVSKRRVLQAMFVTSHESTTHGVTTQVVTTQCFTINCVATQGITIQPSQYGCQNNVSHCMRHNPGCDNTGCHNTGCHYKGCYNTVS